MTDLLEAAERVASAAQDSLTVPTFGVKFERDQDYWLAELVEEPRVHTFGRSVAEAGRRISDATRIWFKISDDSDLLLEARFNDAEVDAELEKGEYLRLLHDELSRELHEVMRANAELLRRRFNLSLRDAGAVLRVSHQRVNQLLEEHVGIPSPTV